MGRMTSRSMASLSMRSCRWLMMATDLLLVVMARNSAAPTIAGTDRAMMYLVQFGYLSPSVQNHCSGHVMDRSSWKKAIAEFQSFAGLNATGSRWRVKNLTYKISKYTHLHRAVVDLEIAKAFNVWSEYIDLTLHRVYHRNDQDRFEKGVHGGGDPFDGPGGTLAHAFFPVYGGNAHFDDAEPWSINTKRLINLFQVDSDNPSSRFRGTPASYR